MAFLVVSITLTSCGKSVPESSLIGSWEPDLAARKNLIFTYRQDHTWTMSRSDRSALSGQMTGSWNLKGKTLTSYTTSVTNEFGTLALPGGPIEDVVSIVALTESNMVWRGERDGIKLRLRKVNR
jgi:hypothetical protein